jgi:hypothetical protein
VHCQSESSGGLIVKKKLNVDLGFQIKINL